MRWFAGTNEKKSFPCPDMKKKERLDERVRMRERERELGLVGDLDVMSFVSPHIFLDYSV